MLLKMRARRCPRFPAKVAVKLGFDYLPSNGFLLSIGFWFVSSEIWDGTETWQCARVFSTLIYFLRVGSYVFMYPLPTFQKSRYGLFGDAL